jgi:hypothetical protein
MSLTWRTFRWGLLPLFLLVACGLAWTRCDEEEDVKVSVVAILATDRNDKVGKGLECVAKEVRKKDEKLTGVRLGNMTCKSIAVGAKAKFDLVEGQTATVTVDHGADQKNRVQLKVKAPKLGEITYDTCCGKFLPIMTPYKTKDGEVLFVLVRVQPCNEK